MHFQQHLEVISWKIGDLIYRERQLHLEDREQQRKARLAANVASAVSVVETNPKSC